MDDARRLIRVLPRLVRAFKRRIGRAAEQEGLEWAQMVVLRGIAEGWAQPGRLARWLHSSPPAVTGAIDRLVERGLVERTRDPNDRRAVQLALTQAGRAEYQRMEDLVSAEADRLLGELTLEEREQLLKGLEALEARLDGMETE